jgi:hypothetical protein
LKREERRLEKAYLRAKRELQRPLIFLEMVYIYIREAARHGSLNPADWS